MTAVSSVVRSIARSAVQNTRIPVGARASSSSEPPKSEERSQSQKTPPPPLAAFAAPKPPGLQRAYVFPTLGNHLVFHPRLPRPRNPLEHGLILSAFIFRKWRYQVSNFFAEHWHRWGALAHQSRSRVGIRVYRVVNSVLTRRAADEYFLKGISPFANQVEFVFPASIHERRVREQVASWLKDASKHRNRAFLTALLLPVNFLIAKVVFLAANVLLVYQLYRFAASMRAHAGAMRLQRMVEQRRVVWTSSEDFEKGIRSISDQVTARLAEEEEKKSVVQGSADENGGVSDGVRVWHWTPLGDIHDDVVMQLQQELNAHELAITYRRTRMEYFVHSMPEGSNGVSGVIKPAQEMKAAPKE